METALSERVTVSVFHKSQADVSKQLNELGKQYEDLKKSLKALEEKVGHFYYPSC